MTDYERGVEQASAIYKEVIREYVAENAKLQELCGDMLLYIAYPYVCVNPSVLVERARELGIEVGE